jgi:nucleoside-diphosphate-sugar epimerase
MTKKITIIGGSGFVGTNLCRNLSLRKQNFEIIDLKKSKSFPGKSKIADVRNFKSLLKAITGDLIVNLAAVHTDNIRDKKAYKETNVDGAQNIILACTKKNIRKIVFTSTVAVYGFAKPGTGENGQIAPFNDYGKTKFEAEQKFIDWQNKTKNSLIIIRPTAIFGEGNRGNVFNLFNQIALKRFLMVGKGENVKSLAYIKNVVSFLDTCILSDEKFGIYNYIDTPNLTMNELIKFAYLQLHGEVNTGPRIPLWAGILLGYTADLVSKIFNKNLPVSSIRIKKFISTTEFTSNKLNLNDFKPPFTLLQGLTNTIQNEFISPKPQKEIFFTE